MTSKMAEGLDMVEITYDVARCKKCGLCTRACPVVILRQEEEGAVPTVDTAGLARCIRCGHCVAVCPQGGLSHSHFSEGTVTPIRSEVVPAYEQVLELVRSRRSKRSFKEQPVEKDLIEKVLDAARFGPSAHNEQTTEFVVIQDRDTIDALGALTAKGLAKMAMPFGSAVGRTIMGLMLGRRTAEYVAGLAPEMAKLAAMYDDGKDLILHEPPVLILFCADSAGGTFASTNANIALHNAVLASETLGLGCFYAGFVVHASDRDSSIAQLVGLPETHKIYGALAVGHPRLKYRNWPERNPASVTWLEATKA